MSRPLRIEQANSWYYVRNISRKGRNIFSTTKDIKMFLSLLQDASDRYGITCHCYAFLNKEYHLLLFTSSANLGHFMRQLNSIYTQSYNRKYQQDGSLFKGRYQSTLLDSTNYPLWISLHIHQLFLINKGTHDGHNLSCSSHEFYLECNDENSILTTKVLKPQLDAYFGKYSESNLLISKLPSVVADSVKRKHLPAIVGCSEFKEKYQQLIEHSDKECCALLHMRETKNKNSIINFTAKEFQVSTSQILKSQYGANNNSDARNMAMFLCQQHTSLTLREIAGVFGVKHYASISNRIAHFKKALSNQTNLQTIIHCINKKLQKEISI